MQAGAAPTVRGIDIGSLLGGRARATAYDNARVAAAFGDAADHFASIGVRRDEGITRTAARFDPTYENAHYDPQTDSFVVGYNGETRVPFYEAPDVIAHELAHRVISTIVPQALTMSDDALHESIADVLAASFDGDDWDLGEGTGIPIRSMANPELSGAMTGVDTLVKVGNDVGEGSFRNLAHAFVQGGVEGAAQHMSHGPLQIAGIDRAGLPVLMLDRYSVAGITNRAASLIGTVIGRQAMGEVYVEALRGMGKHGALTFTGLVTETTAAVDRRFGISSPEAASVRDAWRAVGLVDPDGRVKDVDTYLDDVVQTANDTFRQAVRDIAPRRAPSTGGPGGTVVVYLPFDGATTGGHGPGCSH